MKKKNAIQTLQTYKVGVFEIRLSEAKVEIETNSKEWKYIIASGTRPFAELVALISRDKKESIHVLCNALYSSTLFFYYPDFCVEFVGRCDEYVKQLKEDAKME
jgi:hypothetical protein